MNKKHFNTKIWINNLLCALIYFWNNIAVLLHYYTSPWISSYLCAMLAILLWCIFKKTKHFRTITYIELWNEYRSHLTYKQKIMTDTKQKIWNENHLASWEINKSPLFPPSLSLPLSLSFSFSTKWVYFHDVTVVIKHNIFLYTSNY